MDLHKVEPLLEYFKIIGLHKERDITLEMNGNVKILVGDNGSGKTTLLNCMYYILNKQFYKLNNICFEAIEIKFGNGVFLRLESSELSKKGNKNRSHNKLIRELRSYIPVSSLHYMIKAASTMPYFAFMNDPKCRSVINNIPHSTRSVYEGFKSYYDDEIEDSEFSKEEEWSKIIDENFHLSILYLPTYRRVEEDIIKLGGLENEFTDSLINFGMSDVKERFKQIRNELRESAVSLYTNLNGKMLTQLTSDYQATSEQYEKLKDIDALTIVLDRVGDSISPDTKDNIIRLVEQSVIESERYYPLVFVLANLIEVYYEQKELDDAVKEFVTVANKYLVNKTFIYDESKVEITISNNRTQSEVELDNLSSGEKQLVSILSKLYLDREKTYAILFDEPELSLSLEWQIELLPDILNSQRCGFLLSATHSPFIFQNQLDTLTDSLCVEYRED
ncbi:MULTISPECIES: AAA family ATPase [Vibrio]|uniref:AAA family ATPase n=1 Tax=Vibrio TaxID=662 RepID=UPI00160CA6C7|nr:AAA family ATPase [Vibrio crassostreae]